VFLTVGHCDDDALRNARQKVYATSIQPVVNAAPNDPIFATA